MLENGHPLAHLGLCKYLFRTYAAILFGLTAQNAHSTARAVPAQTPIRIGIIQSIYAALFRPPLFIGFPEGNQILNTRADPKLQRP